MDYNGGLIPPKRMRKRTTEPGKAMTAFAFPESGSSSSPLLKKIFPRKIDPSDAEMSPHRVGIKKRSGLINAGNRYGIITSPVFTEISLNLSRRDQSLSCSTFFAALQSENPPISHLLIDNSISEISKKQTVAILFELPEFKTPAYAESPRTPFETKYMNNRSEIVREADNPNRTVLNRSSTYVATIEMIRPTENNIIRSSIGFAIPNPGIELCDRPIPPIAA